MMLGVTRQAVGFETEAYAILDTLAYIKPDLHTLVRIYHHQRLANYPLSSRDVPAVSGPTSRSKLFESNGAVLLA